MHPGRVVAKVPGLPVMARVLGGVCSLSEVRLLLLSEVDILDFKDLNGGVLGALPLPSRRACL